MKLQRIVSTLLITGVLCCTPVLVNAQDAEQTPEASPGLSIHVVQRGENLFRIALRYNTTVEDLATMNGLLDVNSLEIGQRLLVPMAGTDQGENLITPISESAAVPAGQASQPSFLHTVQPNETLFRIALKYNISIQEIAAANSITDPTLIYVGQRLLIPNITLPEIITDNLPTPLTSIQIRPVIFIEGETGVVEITTSQPATLSGLFLETPLEFIAVENGTRHFALVGIPVFTAPEVYSLQVNLGNDDAYSFDVLVVSGGYVTQNLTVSEEMQGLLAPAVQDNELALLRQITSPIIPDRYWDSPFSIPAAAAMNAGFGTNRSYNGGPINTFHSGADFAAAPNTPIFAAAPGVVVLADTLNIRGNTVALNHGWGVYSVYAHLTTINVQLGQSVPVGAVLGTAGSTGRVTGPHLHWEVWVRGIPVDPLQWTQWQIP